MTEAEDALISAAPEGKGDILLLQKERTVYKHIHILQNFF